MAGIYDEVEIEDLDFNADNKTFYYPCPCGDKFFITLVSRAIEMGKEAVRWKCSWVAYAVRA